MSRIHSTEFTAWGKTQEIRYVCDDGEACDARWQDQEAESLENQVKAIILEQVSLPGTPFGIAARATTSIMKLLELPF